METGTLTEDKKARMLKATPDARDLCYDLRHERIFFVDQFHETDFRKISSGVMMGVRVFSLSEVLDVKEQPDMKVISDMLRERTCCATVHGSDGAGWAALLKTSMASQATMSD